MISPMLLAEEIQIKNDFITELKLDGIRLIGSNLNSEQFYSRHKNLVTERFPELHGLIPKGTIVDGELIIENEQGKPDFEAVQSRFNTTNDLKIKRFSKTNPLTYVVFDILHYQHKDITKLNLMQRKEILAETIQETERINIMRFVEGKAEEMFQLCLEHDLEGIVTKEKQSIYELDKRSKAWNKRICYKELQDVYITGFCKDKIGWLLSLKEKNSFRFVGTLELGLSQKVCRSFYKVANQIKVGETDKHVYIEPVIKCKVKYRNWTKNNLLRLPVFMDFCFDQSAA